MLASVDLFESKPVPTKQKLYKHRAYIVAGYQGTLTSFLHNQNNRKTSPKRSKNSECSSSIHNTLKLEKIQKQCSRIRNFKSEFVVAAYTTHKPTLSPSICLHK